MNIFPIVLLISWYVFIPLSLSQWTSITPIFIATSFFANVLNCFYFFVIQYFYFCLQCRGYSHIWSDVDVSWSLWMCSYVCQQQRVEFNITPEGNVWNIVFQSCKDTHRGGVSHSLSTRIWNHFTEPTANSCQAHWGSLSV